MDIRGSFEWFFGVVEDRNDPLQLGRVRVRAMGYHSGDAVNDLPVKQLPWAQPIQSITSAAHSGFGHSPTGLVEGTWVFGFFADGEEAQRPYICGSLAGIPTGDSAPGQTGFRDPQGKYPLDDRVGEPDTPRLARSEAEFAPSLVNRRKSRMTSINIAIAPWANAAANTISSSKGSGGQYPYLRETWNEVNPRYDGEGEYSNKVSSMYPYNHVYQGESGNIKEYDETPGNTRILEQHASGTFQEVQHSGTKTTKVVGDNYEIIAGKDNIFIAGDFNLTVQGNVNILNNGDVRHEIDGDYYLTVRGDRITKIQGNDVTEILTDESTQINGNKNERVAKEKREITDFTFTETVGNNHISTVKKNRRISIFHNLAETITGNTTFISIQNSDFGAGKNMNLGAGVNFNMRAQNGFATLQTALTFTETIGTDKTSTTGGYWDHTSTGYVFIRGSRIDLNE